MLLGVAMRVGRTFSAFGALQINGARVGGAAIFGMMIWLLFIRFIVPVLGVFYGTALIADEVDDKTITYLFTRPIPRRGRPRRQVPRVSGLHGPAGAAVGRCVRLLPDRAARRRQHRRVVPVARRRTWGCWPSGWPPTARVFALVGARLKRPLVVGLVFAFGWEPAVLLVPGLPEAADRRLLPAGAGAARDAAGLGGQRADAGVPGGPDRRRQPDLRWPSSSALALWLAGRAVDSREYVLEQ